MWYLIGAGSMILISKYGLKSDITVGDLLMSLTVGGIGGLFTCITGLVYIDWDNTFFSKKIW